MKTSKVIMTVLAFIALINVATAQTYKEDSQKNLENLQKQASIINFLPVQNISALDANNNIRVLQIGDRNAAYTLTRSNSSNIELTQLGNRNGISLAISANRINEDVMQIGNNHSFTDLSANRDLHSANVLQFGANQNLIWLGGQNSISDKMIVTMQGKEQTVIIRNLNN